MVGKYCENIIIYCIILKYHVYQKIQYHSGVVRMMMMMMMMMMAMIMIMIIIMAVGYTGHMAGSLPWRK